MNGKDVANVLEKELQLRVEAFQRVAKKPPGLAVVFVGNDPSSQIYIRNKEEACRRVGIHSVRYDIDKKTSVEELDALMNRLNADEDIHGILVQIPIPKPFEYSRVLKRLNPLKDVDGLTYENLGLLWAGCPRVEPCTPKGVMALLEYYKISVKGKYAVVVGRSRIVGKPMAQLLMNQNSTVTICHSQTLNLTLYTRQADIVVVAAGQPHLLGKEDFKKGAVVVDVGIHRKETGGLCGDVRFDELYHHVKAATPVPKGVGPMTITMLLENTLYLAESSLKR